MRISLRELMIVVAVAAVGLAGLKFASSGMLPIVQALTGLLLAGFLVKAIVDQGSGRAFAIGFMACASAYTLVLSWTLYRTPGSADETIRVTPVGTCSDASCGKKLDFAWFLWYYHRRKCGER